MVIHYKATRTDGTDFYTGEVDYAGALASGELVMHPRQYWEDASGYLSVSVEPAETLIGGSWPCRLFEVEPVGGAVSVGDYPHKRAVHVLRMVREIESWQALGPQGQHVDAFIKRIPTTLRNAAGCAAMDAAGCAARNAARNAAGCAARIAAWEVARNAAGNAAWKVARNAAGNAARGAAGGLLVRDLISPDQFQTLVEPWKILTGEEL